MTTRVTELELEKFKNNALCEGLSLNDYVKKAINYYETHKAHVEHYGGMVLLVPNPKYNWFTPEKAVLHYQILLDASKKLSDNIPGVDFGLSDISKFAWDKMSARFSEEYEKELAEMKEAVSKSE